MEPDQIGPRTVEVCNGCPALHTIEHKPENYNYRMGCAYYCHFDRDPNGGRQVAHSRMPCLSVYTPSWCPAKVKEKP